MDIKIGKYKHFKKQPNGNDSYCEVIGVGEHSETNEVLVVYRLLSTPGSKLKARPIGLFLEKVDKDKYPNCEQEYKFEYVGG